MTRLVRLRTQILIAMGLPACWTQSTPSTTTAPEPIETPGVFVANACRADTIPETICGSVDVEHKPGATCGQRGDSLRSFGESKLYITVPGGQQSPALRHFRLDDAATSGYRTTLTTLDPAWLPGYCCYSRCTPLNVSKAISVKLPPNHHLEARCLRSPPGGTRQPAATNSTCPAAIQLLGGQRNYTSGDASQCCYSVPIENPEEIRHYRGRAARIDGTPRFAEIGRGTAWVTASYAVDTDAAHATHWLEAAKMEHASIAAFAKLSLQLLAVGAPPELLAGAHRAALDEIEHARVAFEIASAYAATPLAPIAFGDAARMTANASPETGIEQLARETFVDGCIEETAAALQAEHDADAATDPAIARALRRIAEDETRHAQLAWSIVAWCVKREPALLDVLQAELDAQPPSLFVREVVAPCLAALRADKLL